MGNMTRGMLVHIHGPGIDQLSQDPRPMHDVLKAWEEVILDVAGPGREDVRVVLDANLYLAMDPNGNFNDVKKLVGHKAMQALGDYNQERGTAWQIPVDPADGVAEPTCVRYEWVNGSIKCRYNYAITSPVVPDANIAFQLSVNLEGHYAYDMP